MNLQRIDRATIVQFVKVVVSGGASTLVYFALLNILRFGLGLTSFWSVTGAFIVATASNYILNRWWSFRLTGQVKASEPASFYVVSGGAWFITVVIVQTSEHFFGPLGPLGLNLTNLVADGLIIVPKFLAFKYLVFRGSLHRQGSTLDPVVEVDDGVELDASDA